MTASYVSEAMQALDKKAKEAGVTLLCEMGLDPGIGISQPSILKVVSLSAEIRVNTILSLLFL